MSASKDLRWLLVGTGDIVCKRVASALRDTPSSCIRAICGGVERATAIAGQHGIDRVHAHLDEALAEDDIDAVYIATPVYRHRPEAVKAIEAGKHVLIEKPLGLTAADAQPIVDAAASTGVIAGCAYYRRCYPSYRGLRMQVSAGELGKVTLVRATYHGWFEPAPGDPKRWRVDSAMSGSGPLSDMGCHMLDLIVGLFGLPESVFAHADAIVHRDWTVEDSSAVVMLLTNGAHVLASFGWNSKTWVHEFEVVGSEARVRWCPVDAGKVATTVGRELSETDVPNTENVHRPLIEDFVEAVREGRQPICPLAEAIKTNVVMDAIISSARTGKAVPVLEMVAT